MNIEESKNKEYEEVKHSIVGEAIEEVESSQKANSNANATLGSSRNELVMPTDISQGEIVNSAALPSLDGKNKSDKDDASENFGAEVEPHQKPAAKTNKHAIKTNEKKKSARKKTLRETSVRKDESGAASPEPVDAVMEIESDKSEDDGSGSRQQEEIGQVEVINESVSADVSSSDKKVIPSKPAVSKISNKRTHTQTETRRSRSVKKVASTKKGKSQQKSSSSV